MSDERQLIQVLLLVVLLVFALTFISRAGEAQEPCVTIDAVQECDTDTDCDEKNGSVVCESGLNFTYISY